jgi:hypothetical protein
VRGLNARTSKAAGESTSAEVVPCSIMVVPKTTSQAKTVVEYPLNALVSLGCLSSVDYELDRSLAV